MSRAIVASAIAFLVLTQFTSAYSRGREGIDFRWTIWEPARDLFRGVSPYADPSAASFVAESVYPPLVFIVLSPLSALPFDLAFGAWQVLLFTAAAAVLVVLGVRDWRCYAVWLTSLPVIAGIVFGNATIIVILLVAIAWRFRNRSWVISVALSAAIAIKLVAAPLVLWLLMTRRYVAALLTIVVAPLLILVPWLAIGSDGLVDYPRTLTRLAESHGQNGVLVHAFVRQLDFSRTTALAAAAACAFVCFAVAWRRRHDDTACFALSAFAALLLTPIAWIYYPGLLIVPLAARSPRYSRAWLLVAALWVSWAYTPLGWATWELSAAVILICVSLVALIVAGGFGARARPGSNARAGLVF